MSIFGLFESVVKTVVSPAVDLLEGDLSLSNTRANLSDSLSEVGDTLTGDETDKYKYH